VLAQTRFSASRYFLVMASIQAMSESQTVWIKRLTVTFDAREDRLLLTALCESGEILGLWLTQRLATPLVKVLLARLDQNASPNRPSQQPAPSVQRERALRHWEQSTAHERQLASESKPVALPPEAVTTLVDKVSVSIQSGRARLDFLVDDAAPVSLSMSVMATRQWLAIMRVQYQQADWNVPGLWPVWFDAALRDSRTGGDRVH
jgi:hypothetical protein